MIIFACIHTSGGLVAEGYSNGPRLTSAPLHPPLYSPTAPENMPEIMFVKVNQICFPDQMVGSCSGESRRGLVVASSSLAEITRAPLTRFGFRHVVAVEMK